MQRTLSFLRSFLNEPGGPLFQATSCARIRPPLVLRHRTVCYQKNAYSKLEPSASQRLKELEASIGVLHPRVDQYPDQISCHAFFKRYDGQALEEESKSKDCVVLHGKCLNVLFRRRHGLKLLGRVAGFRVAGSRLVFVDIVERGQCVQGICNFRTLSEGSTTAGQFRHFFRMLQRGDIISTCYHPSYMRAVRNETNEGLGIRGSPHRSHSGQLSVLLSTIPDLVAPCLHRLPTKLQDSETRIRYRHVDFIVNPKAADIIRLKSEVTQYLRQFLVRDGQIEVQTPILADGTGGAIARPFLTSATEFPERTINMRIAPELWLKRMVVGGFDRVFEIGPSFRNEGRYHLLYFILVAYFS